MADSALPPKLAAGLITEAANLVRLAAIAMSGTGWSGELSNLMSELHDWARRVEAA